MHQQLSSILDATLIFRSNLLPADWAEAQRVMSKSESQYDGLFSYDRTPYTREIVNRLATSDPAKIIAVMKGGQVGCSKGVIENGIGWIISQEPGNILFLTGHADLSEESMNNIDGMIDGCGIRHLIRPSVMRVRNSRSGDTNKSKEFPGGSLVSGSATNHKMLRQRSVRYGFIDDFEAAPRATKQSGSTTKMIEQRFAAYYGKMKLFYISTPELKISSNIEPVYLMGDQRKFYVPCPCCGSYITIEWEIDLPDSKSKAGITWKLDDEGKLIPSSVGYICQECGGFFTDAHKQEMNVAGEWRPTAVPVNETYTSYHLSSLYAPPGMFDWKHYVEMYLEANPVGQPQKEHLMKTFVNLALGKTWESSEESPQATQIMKNCRNYAIATLPEQMSIDDGNGSIVLITCACDLNGIVDDARLDYEIVAWTESGSSYSIAHGSIGTFVPREGSMKFKADREKWTYEENKQNSVWPELEKLLDTTFVTSSGKKMKIFVSGVDCGHYTSHAYTYLDKTNHYVLGLRGDKEHKYLPFERNLPIFKVGKERTNYFLLEVGRIKDVLSSRMRLRWNQGNEPQPSGFMNFPQPANGLYGLTNYFEHYESEHRVTEANPDGQAVAAKWVKKNSAVQNHMFDCHVYNMALKDIYVYLVGKDLKQKDFTWRDYVALIKNL